MDDSWKIFGALMVAALLSCAAFCVWKSTAVSTESAAAAVVKAPPPPTVSATVPTAVPQAATGPFLSWQELTLMLRTGLTDDDIIAAVRSRLPSVPVIGPAEAESLHELGAGDKLVNFLRTRPTYPTLPVAERVTVSAPALPRIVPPTRGPGTAPDVLTSRPVDYVARDRQIKDLQSRIGALDRRILEMRSHPDAYRSPMGTYNGPGARYGDESWFKEYLDQLDRQRNDLRRQKWQLEGR